jgi:7,8-dihydro-6-hydroxymethylpterin-pyrophosphokinase
MAQITAKKICKLSDFQWSQRTLDLDELLYNYGIPLKKPP